MAIKKDLVKRKLAKKRYTSTIPTKKEIEFLVEGCEFIPINKLNLWKDNPRYNKEAVPKLAKIFKVHGVRSAVVVWKKNMTIYKGNTTYKALKLLGCKEIPVQFQDFTSEASAKAYGIADNKSSEFSQWDEDVLIDMMQASDMNDFKQVTGFKEVEFDSMIKRKSNNKVDIDAVQLPKCVISYHPEIRVKLKLAILKSIRKEFGDKVFIKYV